MIKVNLLPPEYQVKERTPLPMLLGILGGVAVTSVVVVGFLFLRLVKLPEIKRTLANKEQTRDIYRTKAQKADLLKAEKAKLDTLENAVKKLNTKRYPWTKAVNDLSWMVVKANEDKKHVKAWFESLEFKAADGAAARRGATGAPSGGTIDVKLVVAGREFDHVGVFREVVRKSKGWLGRNILQMPLTSTRVKDFKKYIPDVGLAFPLTITLHPDPQNEKTPESKAGEKGAKKAATGKGDKAAKGAKKDKTGK
ncbi:MAG: hypothetical protein ACYTFG_06660 [Planctomycetota bacterium]|jgi:Tfp pilus assembly protein PilN